MSNRRVIRFGVTRAHGGSQLLDGVRLFGAALEAQLGETVRPTVLEDYEHLLAAVLDGSVDLAWMPPLLHARARGAHLIAVSERGGALTFRAALLVRRDASYQGIKDLRGARAAWSDPNSASGYVFPRLHLRANGIEPRELLSESFFGSASNAMAAVIDGRADLCASFVSDAAGNDHRLAAKDVQRTFAPAGWRLRVFDITDSIPPDGMVVAAAVDAELSAQLRRALLSLDGTADGAHAVRTLMNADRLVPATTGVATVVERLRVRMAR